MLDVDFAQLRQGFARYMPFGLVVAALLLFEMIVVSVAVATRGAAAGQTVPMAAGPGITNAEAIGQVLYTQYAYWFEAAGLVLLIAMIGAIVLTLHHRPHVRRQSVSRQVARNRRSGMDVVQIKSGEGVSE
jgi:NADH-quinone oxidoreductase subunit J